MNRLMLFLALFLVSCFTGQLQAEIKITSYHLRDRAALTDSLVMKKVMIFQFKSSQKLSRIEGSYFAGSISHESGLVVRDTTWVVDEAAGNLAFGLPFDIPDGDYQLEINHLGSRGETLDSYSGTFDRHQLKPYYSREINFWDYTEPYAHLQCAGYGRISYAFDSKKAVTPVKLSLSARMTSDNAGTVSAELFLNGLSLGYFELPPRRGGGKGKIPGGRYLDRGGFPQARDSRHQERSQHI
ncbi:hypothetical protein ACFLT7_02960 [candidate division KSB1 bacterium]